MFNLVVDQNCLFKSFISHSCRLLKLHQLKRAVHQSINLHIRISACNFCRMFLLIPLSMGKARQSLKMVSFSVDCSTRLISSIFRQVWSPQSLPFICLVTLLGTTMSHKLRLSCKFLVWSRLFLAEDGISDLVA